MVAGSFDMGPVLARHRSPLARGLGWLWLAFAGANALDILWRGSDRVAWLVLVLLGLVSVVVWLVSLRPVVEAHAGGVVVRNPLRDVAVPWGAVEEIDATTSLRVFVRGHVVRAWAMQAAPRRARTGSSDASERRSLTWVAQQLREQWLAHRSAAGGPVTQRVFLPGVVALVVAGVALTWAVATVLTGA